MIVLQNHIGEPSIILGITDEDLDIAQRGETLTYLGRRMIHAQNIIVFYEKTRPEMISMLRRMGVPVSADYERKYLAGERTDREAPQ